MRFATIEIFKKNNNKIREMGSRINLYIRHATK